MKKLVNRIQVLAVVAMLAFAAAPQPARAQYDGGGNCPLLAMQTQIRIGLDQRMGADIRSRIRAALDQFGLGCLMSLINLGGLDLLNAVLSFSIDSVCQVLLQHLQSEAGMPKSPTLLPRNTGGGDSSLLTDALRAARAGASQ